MNVDILMYHGFTDKDSHQGIENYNGKHLSISKFEEQVIFLKKKYRIISLKDLMEYYTEGRKFEERSILITIDDGYKSNFTLAFPILQKYQVPAAIFVTTDFIDRKEALWVDRVEYAIDKTRELFIDIELNGQMVRCGLKNTNDKINAEEQIKRALKSLAVDKRNQSLIYLEDYLKQALVFDRIPAIYAPLSWDDIRALHSSGLVEIGSHSCSHTILTHCSDKELHTQIVVSKERIEEMVQAPCISLSYPNGEKGDFSHATHHALSKAGYRCAFVTIIGTNNKLSNRYELNRLNVHNDGGLAGFKRTLSGFARSLRMVKKWKFY